MNRVRQPRSALVNLIRIIHIALWFTIPTTFWLWLTLAPPPQPRACEPYCGWYQGNVLGVSEDTHLFIVFGLFLVGFIAIGCWIAGYCYEITRRVLNGDRSLPSVQLGFIRDGWSLLCSSLKFWLPAFVAFIAFAMLASRFPYAVANIAMLALIPAALMLMWGNLVGIARYAVTGERSLICRRLENMRLALKNLAATILLSLSAYVLATFAVGAFAAVSNLLSSMQVSDLVAEAAFGSFAFYFILLCYCFLCSRLFAGYAKRIARCDNLGHSANPRSKPAGA